MKNTKLRTNAKNELEKNFFKLMNNAVFSKTMENVRNHRDIKLVNTYQKMNKYISEPNFHTSTCFSEDLMAIELTKTDVYMNKPSYIGQAILDLSKIVMYEFYYDYLKAKYRDKVKLCYMDTDSFIIHILTEDFYKDISNDVNKWFDTSGYSKDTNKPVTSGIDKKVLNMFKDELGDDIMIESTNVRAKLYACTRQDTNNSILEKKKAKGTKKCITKKELTHQDFKDAVINNKTTICTQHKIRSYTHQVFTEGVNKIAISLNDDKRIRINNNTTMTYQYGSPTLELILDKK